VRTNAPCGFNENCNEFIKFHNYLKSKRRIYLYFLQSCMNFMVNYMNVYA
jgi:hypothetical protein